MNQHRYIDSHGMVLTDIPADNGRGDAIKRTFQAWFANPKKEYEHGLLSCINGATVLRHPERLDNTMSRDHLTFMYIFLKMKKSPLFNTLVKKTPWKISDRFYQTPDFWLWSRIMTGKRIFELAYYPIMIIFILLAALWNNAVNIIAGYNREFHQDDYIVGMNQTLTKFQFMMKSLRMPSFTIFYRSWQIWALPDSWAKKLLSACFWPLISRHNYVMKLLLNHPVKPRKIDIINYKTMRTDRWAAILNETNTWDTRIIEDTEMTIDVDLLIKIFQS